ncbi:uncharacterized protein BDV14DRAFT_204280 [Aspergillus stella-maris]|uniref:uncharacterized protein n=1 Tax=Aspergillus stella-maris TaxID=1810926 RepID=UPI003CCD107A
MKVFITTAMLLGVTLALPADLPRDTSVTKGTEEATVEAANFYTEFGWQGNGKRDVEEADKATVEAANFYTEFGWQGNGKRDAQPEDAEGATVEAANFYTEFGWQGNGKRDV